MDPLSLLLDDIHLAGVEFRYLHAFRPWGFSFQAKGLASFHLLLSGRAVLHITDEPPITLDAGDMAIVTSGRDHSVLDAEKYPLGTLENIASAITGHHLEPLRIGGEESLLIYYPPALALMSSLRAPF